MSISSDHPVLSDVLNNLEEKRKSYLNNFRSEEEKNKLRDLEDANKVLSVLIHFEKVANIFLTENPAFLSVIENDFTKIENLNNERFVLDRLFYYENLFFKDDDYPISVEGEFHEKLVEGYGESIDHWIDQYIEIHEGCEKNLKENFNIKLNAKSLDCRCNDCVGLFRTRVAEHTKESIHDILTQLEDRIEEDIVHKKINRISYLYSDQDKKIQVILKRARLNLRKSSYNKIYSDTKDYIKKNFSFNPDMRNVATSYVEKVKAYLFSELDEIKPEIFSDEELNRFFSRLGNNLWKPASFLKRDFLRFTQTIFALKRKDVSSSILRDYLGHFWIHSQARRKNRKITYHMGPTNSGKTYNAIEALAKADKGCYLAPLRLLAGEIYDTLNEKGVPTTLLTGEEVIEKEDANHYSSTIEMAKLKDEFNCVVIDEIQMIADTQRGWAWTRALIHMDSEEIHLCGDASALPLVEKILKLTGDELEIKTYERKTELLVEKKPVKMEELRSGDALIVFSRRNALKNKIELEKLGHKVSIIYGALNPDVRREQARRFDEGETSVIVSTDAISMGMNLPVKRIVFSTFVKFIQSREHPLSISHIKQIAGRAGRFGRFPKGYVSYLDLEKNEDGESILQDAMFADLEDKEKSMLGPDLDLYLSVNQALSEEGLITLKFSEFLRLFNEMEFSDPFLCVNLSEMIEVAEMIEAIDDKSSQKMSAKEIFGFSCAPVSLRNPDHLQYFISIVTRFSNGSMIKNDLVDSDSKSIDYLETAIKCVELYQWLARHFDQKYFEFDEMELGINKKAAVAQLNLLLSEKTIKYYDPRKRFERRPGFNRKKKFSKKKYGKKKFNRNSKKYSRRRKTKR